jgi:hypothetical protein
MIRLPRLRRPARFVRHWRGWYVLEEVLRPDFGGRHLAPAIWHYCSQQYRVDQDGPRIGRHVMEIGTFVKLDPL